MTGRERLGLTALGVTTALLSAVAVAYVADHPAPVSAHAPNTEPASVVLQRVLPQTIITASIDTSARERPAEAPVAAERLAYVPSHDFLLRQSLRPDTSAADNPETWMTEPSATSEADPAWAAQTDAGADWQTDVTAKTPVAKSASARSDAGDPPASSIVSTAASSAASSSSAPAELLSGTKGPSLPPATLKERLAQLSPAAIKRMKDKFLSANVFWPPADIALIAIKDKRVLELYARQQPGGSWQHVHRYPVLAASGVPGPKLRQGDRQVPEGIYNVSFLNPNSRYHVSMRLNYPNDFDRQMAAKDGRKELGGDIMIHGKAASIGCLAVGDEAAEELFVLAAETGLPHTKVIIAPADFRRGGIPERQPGQPEWLPKLYTQVASAMSEFPRPPSTGLLSFFEN